MEWFIIAAVAAVVALGVVGAAIVRNRRNRHDNVTRTPQSTPPTRSSSPARPAAPKRDLDRPGRSVRYDRFMEADQESRHFMLDEDGSPTGFLQLHDDQLVIETAGGFIRPGSRHLNRFGIHMFEVQVTPRHRDGTRAGDFSPGQTVLLVREPDHPDDPSAVAVLSTDGHKAGYVDPVNASRLARRIDDGEVIVALSTKGSEPGLAETPHIIAGDALVIDHLTRKL